MPFCLGVVLVSTYARAAISRLRFGVEVQAEM